MRNQLANATRSGCEVIANGALATVLKCAVYVAQCGDAKMAKQRKFARGDATVFSIPYALQKMLGVEVGTELTLAVNIAALVKIRFCSWRDN